MSKKEILHYAKQNDTEWYPTPKKAIDLITEDIRKNKYSFDRVLEPCCGDARVSKSLLSVLDEDAEIFGIEINYHLRIEAKANNVNLVGSDFLNERYFMDKDRLMFLNPPFSNWSDFFIKSIIEFSEFSEDRGYGNNFKIGYFILPPRALDNKRFIEVLEAHSIETIEAVENNIVELDERFRGRRYASREDYSYYEIIDYIDFRESDRGARVDAPLIKIKINYQAENKLKSENFFEFAFKEELKRNSVQDELDNMFSSAKETRDNFKNKKENQLLTGSDIVDMEVLNYTYEFNKIALSIKPILTMPQETLDILEIKMGAVKGIFKQKEKRLRADSWNHIFSELGSIKDKLTTQNRAYLISSFAKDLDFTHTNIREIVISSIRYAGSVMESQISEFYWGLIDGILKTKGNYLSNEIYTKNIRNFRYQKDTDKTNLMLDYRVIIQDDKKYKRYNNTGDWTSDTLENFRVSALLLGFKNPKWEFAGEVGQLSTLYKDRNHTRNPLSVKDKTVYFGRIKEVHKYKKDGKEYTQYKLGDDWVDSSFVYADKDILMTARSYKKGTTHMKLNQKFLMKLTYIALKDKNIIKNSFEFDEYMNGMESEEKGEIKLSKDEVEAIKEISVNGVNPQLVFKNEIKDTKLIGMRA